MTTQDLQGWLTFIDTLGDVGNSARELMIRTAHEMDALQVKRPGKDGSTATRPIADSFTKVATELPFAVATVNTKPLDERNARRRKLLDEEFSPCKGCTGDCGKGTARYKTAHEFFVNGELRYRSVPCQFAATRKLQRQLRSSKIPARYAGKTFDDYTVDKFNRDAVQFARNVDKFKFGAYFYGECGTGKTFLASLIAQDFLSRGKSVIFVKVPSLLDDIKATFDKRGGELELLERIANADLVVLDDFGMEKSTQWAGSTLCKILDMRYDNPRGKTIVTSNLSVDELTYHLNNASDGVNLNGSRIADRLREICKPILLRGVTRRG